MNTFFVKNSQINNKKAYIIEDDFHHIKNVLRLKIGEKIYICDENASKYCAKLSDYTQNEAIFEIIEKLDIRVEMPVKVTLFQGLPKQEKMELIIQKCTELGVFEIQPVTMERTIVKLDGKDIDKKIERGQKIAKEAARTVW